MPPGRKNVDRIRARSADLRDLRRIVGLAELGIELACELALVEALVARQRIGAGRVVGRQDEGLLVARGIGVVAHRLVQIVVLPGDVEIVFVAFGARERRGTGVGRKIELALRDRVRHDGHGKIGPDDSGQDVDLFALDHLVGDLHRKLRLHRVILDDDLDVLVARLLDGKQEAVAHVEAKSRSAARKRGDHADLDGLGDGSARHTDREPEQTRHHSSPHCLLLPMDLSGSQPIQAASAWLVQHFSGSPVPVLPPLATAIAGTEVCAVSRKADAVPPPCIAEISVAFENDSPSSSVGRIERA